ncbi:MAG: ribonuclease III, partial [Bacteroidaceae bacterium]|nr:ribonuclease III [Bacteroidaceae bacterium]
SLDEFNSPVFVTEVIVEGIHACKGKGYSKKESQQIAAHETLNKIKKSSPFVESIFAAKALREEPKEMAVSEDVSKQETTEPEVAIQRSEDMEEIIKAAEEAAYSTT